MPDIKTRAVAEKSVKTLDKSTIAAQRMKNAYVQAKEKVERRVPSGEDSPEGYAVDRVSDAESAAVYEGIHQLDRQGRRGIDATKENFVKLKARFQRERLINPLKKKVQKEAASPPVDAEGNIRRGNGIQRAANPIRRPADTLKKAVPALRGEQGPVKAVKRTGKVVKQSARTTGQAMTKTSRRAVKTAHSSAKTAEAMGRTAAATAKKAGEASMTAVRAIITGTRVLIAAIAAMGWVAVVLLPAPAPSGRRYWQFTQSRPPPTWRPPRKWLPWTMPKRNCSKKSFGR